MLEAQQLVVDERSLDERSLLTMADAGPTRARGIIARLLREEHAEGSAMKSDAVDIVGW